jgi:adhesin transport system membrane fusion protein
MLNLSSNSVGHKVDKRLYRSFQLLVDYKIKRILLILLLVGFVLFCIVLFLPWTQNISSKGVVTTLKPNQRPQTINSVIAGKIEKWHVQEGDSVKKGDTILFISEIKDEYFDPQLLSNTQDQIKSKELKVSSYMEKVKALDNQIDAMLRTKNLKLEQAKNYVKQASLKIASDSMDVQAAETNLQVAEKQFIRIEELYVQGLKSLSDLEEKKLKSQETKAKFFSAENKLLGSKNELINAKVELSSIASQFMDKLAKAESEKYASLSNMYEAEATVTKMQNQYINYSVRSGYYYITAPQDGFITKTLKSGIGETIKEGEQLVSIMPADYDLAVSMYIRPMDLPLIQSGQELRLIFDGWPTIVFTGWPNMSYGTFGGKIVAVDNFISENGKYRILVAQSTDAPWPKQLKVGSGVRGMALLNEVPIWYELWRNLNGFPSDFYDKKLTTVKWVK